MVRLPKLTLITKKIISVLFFCLIAAIGLSLNSGYAQDDFNAKQVPDANECGVSETPSYSAFIEAPSGVYDVYARLGRRGQSAAATGYETTIQGTCRTIGTAALTANSWQKVGELNNSDGTVEAVTLASEALNSLPDANRPTVMLISRDDPVCQPTDECRVKINGASGYVRAAGTLLNEDSLHVVRVVDPAKDTIKQVEYYVGTTLAYKLPDLKPFDLRYIPGGKHEIARVITYSSKQKVILPQNVEQGITDGFRNYLFTLSSSNKVLMLVLGLLSVGLILSLTVLKVGRLLYKRRMWKVNHGEIVEPAPEPTLAPAENMQQGVANPVFSPAPPAWHRTVRAALPYLALLIVALILIVTVNAKIFQIYQTDGVSMQSTLKTGDQLVVNKLGKSWASLNGNEYVPKRGEIIVIHKPQSTEDIPGMKSETKKLYIVKRVLGLPGEHVIVKDGKITVYNEANENGFNPDEGARWSSSMRRDTGEDLDIQLGASEIFVAGDNRPESVDSRYNGPIETKEVIGNAVIRIWPLRKISSL